MQQIERIRLKMSDDEIHEANKESAEAAIDLAQLEAQKKEYNQDINARINSLKKRVLDKANQAKTGTKEESLSVWVHFDPDTETAHFYENQAMKESNLGSRPMTENELENPTLWGGEVSDEEDEEDEENED